MIRAVPPSHIAFTVVLIATGGLAGYGLSHLGMPLPYMLGSLIVTALIVGIGQTRFPANYRYPERFRMLFIGIIGVMIGGRVTPELVSMVPKLAISIPAVLLFVVVAHWTNFQIMRRIGGHDPATAFYASSPGGLIESITFGEEAGADLRILTLMQFLRIIVVVTLVPFGMSLYEGHPVGSSAGAGMGPTGATPVDILIAVVLALAGLFLGLRLKFPAGQMTGPLFLAGLLGGLGLIHIATPGWLIAASQVVLGVGLGLRFTGITKTMLMKGAGLSVLSVSTMLAIGVALAALVSSVSGLEPDMLVISFAPGGVTEMSLIALSLAVNPAFVAVHHLIRIVFTVVELGFMRKSGWVKF